MWKTFGILYQVHDILLLETCAHSINQAGVFESTKLLILKLFMLLFLVIMQQYEMVLSMKI